MPLVQMQHENDPKEEIINGVKDYLDSVHLTGCQVLMGIYVRPEKTKGGLILTDAYREEDIYQGKAGLILKMGPMTYSDEEKDFFGDRLPQVGDWVMYRPSDGFPMQFGNKVDCRILPKRTYIKLILDAPDLVW